MRPSPLPMPSTAVRLTAGSVSLAVILAWVAMAFVDAEADDGALSMIALFGLPMVISALLVEYFRITLRGDARIPRAVWWWMFGVLPVGMSGAFAVGAFREPDYFIGDDGPWMLIWIPIFVGAAILLGFVAWFFFVFPIGLIVQNVGAYRRGETKKMIIIGPLFLLVVGVACIIGGLSIDTAGVGRAAWGAVIAAFLGLPGRYDVVWEEGLWVARVLFVVTIAAIAVPPVIDRFKSRR